MDALLSDLRAKNRLGRDGRIKLTLEQARLEKEAKLEKQKAFTQEYFKDKELDNERAAVEALNGSVTTIITDADGTGYSGLVGLDRALKELKE